MTASDSTTPITIHAVGASSDATRAIMEATQALGFGLRSYSDAEQLVASAAPSAAGCIVLASTADVVSDEACLGQFSHYFEAMPVIVLVEPMSAEHAVILMRLGAFSVIGTATAHEQIVSEITEAANVSLRDQSSLDDSRDASRRMQEATEKELAVLKLIMAGMKNKEIAAELGVTTRAVEDRRFRLMKKVGADSVAELVAIAVQARYFDEGRTATRRGSSAPASPTGRQCVKAIEVWVPDEEQATLVLAQSCYRDAFAFRDASQNMRFARGEGLPGRVWQEKAPAFLKDLITTEFVRADIAGVDGVTTAVGLPVFESGEVVAVVLLLLDTRQQTNAAFERWRFEPNHGGLRLSAGTYINCERLRRISEFLVLPPGEGMPGLCADQSRSVLISQLNEDGNVVRGLALAAEGMVSGLALPLTDSGLEVPDVFLLFNARSMPVFSLMQHWKPGVNGDDMTLVAEHIGGVATLSSQLSGLSDPDGTGLAATAFRTARPAVVGNGSASDSIVRSQDRHTLTLGLAIPTIVNGQVTAVTVLAN